MRLLLINPRFPESFWSFRWAINDVLPGKRAVNPPLGLATVAAMCPSGWEVTIVDENVDPVPLEPQADIVGICGMGVQFGRQSELLQYYKSKGYFVVAGGSYASLCPEKFAALADSVVAGESEYQWLQFCKDYDLGIPQALYQETDTVALTDSPTPRFDLLKLGLYNYVSLQYSRGCPFRCEFCDIIVMFGRRPRVKSLEQVGRELDALRALGVRKVFFVDDNLIGNRPQVKLLLKFLVEYQVKHDFKFSFGTEASLNLAQDTELLELFRDAGFSWVFIGIESPDPASLKETKKTQNLQPDLVASIRNIYSYGVDVLGGFIIGFDNDTIDTFELQYKFIMDTGIQAAMVGLLAALPRTPLYERLQKEGRLMPQNETRENTRPSTNIVPKQMDYDTMVEAYQRLYQRLLTDRSIADRILTKLRYMRNPIYRAEFTVSESLGITWRLLTKGVFPGGLGRTYHFLRTFPWFSPSRLSLVASDWITGLAMRDYVERRFELTPADLESTSRSVDSVRAAIARYIESGKVTLGLRAGQSPVLSLSLEAPTDSNFFSAVGPTLERYLHQSQASLALRIGAFQPHLREPLQALLRRLARYGDRVSIDVDEKLRALVPIDSSVFNFVLAARSSPVAGRVTG